jgi:hypothetical protein
VKIGAPFTLIQVELLNKWQTNPHTHPYTCGHCRDELGASSSQWAKAHESNTDRHLIATTAGWICETCEYTQDWADDGMVLDYGP